MADNLTGPESDLFKPTELEIRVRYPETDRMGVVYHGNYFTWFEMGRTEHLRQTTGISYRDLEEAQTLFMVVKVECEYKSPAYYDDLLILKTSVVRMTSVRIEHHYELYRGDLLLAAAKTTVVCVNGQGKVCQVPAGILKRAIPKTRRRVFDFVKRDDLYERCCGKSAIFAFCGKFARFSAFLPSQTALIMPSGHGIPLVF